MFRVRDLERRHYVCRMKRMIFALLYEIGFLGIIVVIKRCSLDEWNKIVLIIGLLLSTQDHK